MRNAFGDIIESRQRILDPGFMRDGDDVQQSVGGSAHRDVECNGVVDCVGGDDVAEANPLAEELEQLMRGGAGQLVPLW